MTETANKILPGQPCWIELYTAEPETSAEFYRELFGWNIEKGDPDSPLANVMSLSENMIGTIEPLSEEAPYSGWLVCLTMSDMSDFADKVEAAGGDVIIAPVRVDEAMVYAVVEDPDGSRVGALHDPTFTGSSSVPVAGMPVWYDVMSRNFERCGAFYGDVFGWDRHPIDGDEVPYITNGEGDNAVCGIGKMAHCEGPVAIPGWRVHIGVTNVDEAVTQVLRLGGEILSEAADTPWGRMAEAADPHGARFVLFQV